MKFNEHLKPLNHYMYIQSILSYKGAWDFIKEHHKNEIEEIVDAYSDYVNSHKNLDKNNRIFPREAWEKALYSRGWEILERTFYSTDGTRVPIGNIGPVKNYIGAHAAMGMLDSLSRWIFQQSALAIRHKVIKLPVLCVPMTELSKKMNGGAHARGNTFEILSSQLELLSPLSHSYPFLIIGMSDQESSDGLNIIEIESDKDIKSEKTIIDRSIKFPPEYQQAGLGILNYFNVYLREQYPNEDATISIEQNGLNIRLIIETPNGESEVVEKALHEFELIVSERKPPETFTNNDKIIVELRHEIRMFKSRVEFSQDIIGIKDKQINQLLELVSQGLAKPSPVVIDFKPNITNSNILQVNKDLASAIGSIEELVSLLPQSSRESLMLSEVAGSLETIETQSNPELVRKSPAMSKFRRVIEKFLDVSDSTNETISKIENGVDIAKNLGKKYNSLAEWCGLPVIPSLLVN